MSDRSAVAATFVSEYYTLYCSQPRDLGRLYTENVYVCHGDDRSTRANGAKEADALLANMYPQSNHGKISVREVELPPVSAGSDVALSIRVHGRFTPTAGDKAIKDFTQRFEIVEHPYPDPQTGLSVFGVKSDIISWTAVAEATAAKAAPGTVAQPRGPPTVHTDWATETPPLFAQTAPPAEISPMDKPLTAATVPPAAPLPEAKKEEPKHVDPTAEAKKPTAADIVAGKKAAPEQKKEAPKKEVPAAKPAEKKETPEVPEEAPAPAEVKQEEPAAKTEEPIDFSKMTMVERLRYKQGIPPTEKKPTPEKKEEPKKDGDRRKSENSKKEGTEKKESGRRDGAKKEGSDRKKESTDKKPAEKKGEKKEGGRKDEKTSSSTTTGGSGGEKKLAKDVVYYDLILKGLPKGTKAEQIDTLLEPYLSYVKPIKLEAQPDKNEPSTIRTFAFIKLDGKGGKFTTPDEAIAGLKGKKIGSTTVIFDRVREKFEK